MSRKFIPWHKIATADELINRLAIAVNAPSQPVRDGLMRLGLKGEKCEACGQQTWHGYRIPLDLHHKDGNRKHNNFDNLELRCPNCHATHHRPQWRLGEFAPPYTFTSRPRKYKGIGRPPKLYQYQDTVWKFMQQGFGARRIAKKLFIPLSSVCKIMTCLRREKILPKPVLETNLQQ